MRVAKIFKNLSTINKSILTSSFWLILGTVVSRFLLLVATIIIANFITKTQYGEFGIIKSTINMFAVFAGLGLGLTATKFIAEYKRNDVEKVSRILGLTNLFSIIVGLFVLAFFMFFSDVLAQKINAPHLASQLRLSGIILFFSALNGIQTGILDGFEKFKAISINNIIASLFSVTFQIIGAIYFGLNGVIVGFGFFFVVLYILNFDTIRRIIKDQFKLSMMEFANFQEIRVIWRFSIPAVLSGLMVSPVVWLTNSFLVNQPHGYEQMAVFDIGTQWRTTVLFIPTALCQIALPMLASAEGYEYDVILRKNIMLNFFISAIIVILIIVFFPLVLTFYGDEYEGAYAPLIVLMLSTILVAVNNVIGQAIASLNRMWTALFANFIWAISILFFAYYFVCILQLGVMGMAYAYLISYSIHSLVQYFIYLKIRKG